MSYPSLPHQHGEQETAPALMEQLQQIDNFQAVAEVFKQLGDPTRVRIFWLLCHCEECVINISSMMEMSSPAVSHHLRPLKNSGLIVSRREGKEVYYKAADTPQSQLLHQMIEQVMEITCPKHLAESRESSKKAITSYQAEQEEIVREIHEKLLTNLDQRVTIECLAKQYLMNPTTLKSVFKAVYGTSLANHMKVHRMEHAAKLLLETNDSIVQISRAVGYDTQSKFTAAFKDHFHVSPTEYRKQNA